jgi:eukaryotic-like serine/threonine-protein kinase
MAKQDIRSCPECGAPLPAHSQNQLCPKCLLGAALTTVPAGQPGVTQESGAMHQTHGLPGPGDELGHYRVLRILGEGGMGAVFEAQDMETGRQVALKVLSHALDSPAARQRFFREGRLAASLNHPNSVYVFGTEEISGTPVIAMELVGGGTLQDKVRNLGPLAPAEAVDAVLQIISGLEAAQRLGILHRDIKPSNCFVGPGGIVKVGDFGLSISTSIRLEPSLTATGSFLGTPAFSSPEQLRGDELSFRADMYSVGATLFYLLTGRTPFEGKTEVQLLAAVLEQRAPSVRQLRPQVSAGLARAVARCLEKEPSERFSSYADLTRALAPYGSTAPTPATIGLRFGAGVVDVALLSIFGSVAAMMATNPLELLNQLAEGKPSAIAWMAAGLTVSLGYYTLLEGLRGATLGKALFGLRVVGAAHLPAGLTRAFSRALIYVLLPALPYWVLYGTHLKTVVHSFAWQQAIGFVYYLVLAAFFLTARRRNGFAAVQDLLTGTRVVSKAAVEARPVLGPPEPAPALGTFAAKVGPYHVLETLSLGPTEEWLVGYDLCLLRKVWIRQVAPGTPPTPAELRNLGRATRLRWLGGRRSAEENWDVYEALSGRPLQVVALERQSWKQTRFWLYDLATELAAAHADNTVPATLDIDRVWITAEGNAKLLDFPVPGTVGVRSGSPQSEPVAGNFSPLALPALVQAMGEPERCRLFLTRVAALALNGDSLLSSTGRPIPSAPVPLHARAFLERMPELPSAPAVALALKPLLNRVAVISRVRRAALIAGCVAVPLFSVCALFVGTSMLAKSGPTTSELMRLSAVLQTRQAAVSGIFRNSPHPTDKQFAVYIATHYGSLITNNATWSSPFAFSMMRQAARDFAKKSVADNPSPSPEEQADAEMAMKPYAGAAQGLDLKKQPWFPVVFIIVSLGIYVGLPALIAALAFRGGLLLLATGIAYVRNDGQRASRLRVFWRAIVAWSVVPIAFLIQLLLSASLHLLGAAIAGLTAIAILTAVSLSLPERGLPERLSGTWPVPR